MTWEKVTRLHVVACQERIASLGSRHLACFLPAGAQARNKLLKKQQQQQHNATAAAEQAGQAAIAAATAGQKAAAVRMKQKVAQLSPTKGWLLQTTQLTDQMSGSGLAAFAHGSR